MSSINLTRIRNELEMLKKNPAPGITCWQDDKDSRILLAEMTGPEGSPYEGGYFTLEINIGERYPFSPPNIKFITPIYHPNVDPEGRICLAGLKPKPQGQWTCALNIAILLSSIRVLLNEPNLGDPLMINIAAEVAENYDLYRKKAEESTRNHAVKLKRGQKRSIDEVNGN